MINWIDGLQKALGYIESHLTDDLQTEDVARQACVSPFHFQRLFGAVCGITLGEYIRLRRLTLAGEELSRGHARVIDVALKYGYDSPDSFARAFSRFHGVTPSAARESGVSLNAFSPLRITLTTEGGHTMEYRIVEKQPFTLMGKGRMFSNETSYQEIPKFWDEYLSSDDKPVCGRFGVCLDEKNSREFKYLIADLYKPWEDIPDGCDTVVAFPAGTWAVFPCTMDTLQDTNTRMWKEWLPACKEYRLGGGWNLEMYAPLQENYVELWLPLEKL